MAVLTPIWSSRHSGGSGQPRNVPGQNLLGRSSSWHHSPPRSFSYRNLSILVSWLRGRMRDWVRETGGKHLQSGPRPQNPNLEQQVPSWHGLSLSQPSLKSHVLRHPAPQWDSVVPQKPNSLQHPVAQWFVALHSCPKESEGSKKMRVPSNKGRWAKRRRGPMATMVKERR